MTREEFEAWYSIQPCDLQPWDVWRAATTAALERAAEEIVHY